MIAGSFLKFKVSWPIGIGTTRFWAVSTILALGEKLDDLSI
jgi:hypothetical protein